MRTISIDVNNDIFLKEGNICISEDAEATGMVVANKIRTLKGEIPLNTEDGIPYLDILQSSNPDLSLFQFYLMSTAKKEPTVTSIKNLEFKSQNDVLSYIIELETKYDEEVTING